MPLLPLEPFIQPDDLLSGPALPGRWWVLHTRPRAEKGLVRRLHASGARFFLPLFQRQWRSQGRRLCSHLPLFPGYVFLCGEAQDRLKALETNLVVNCLHVEDQAELHADLARVYQMIAAGAPLTPEERLEPGTPVEITAGPLAGLEGKVLRRGAQLNIVVEVKFLQQGVSAEIESWMVRALERDGRSGSLLCVAGR